MVKDGERGYGYCASLRHLYSNGRTTVYYNAIRRHWYCQMHNEDTKTRNSLDTQPKLFGASDYGPQDFSAVGTTKNGVF